MRWSHALIPTLKETPADAVAPSHVLLLRAGMIRQLGAGAYTYMPLGLRVLQKVVQIVREEMDAAGAIELLMPALQPVELWKESGRYEAYGDLLMKLTISGGHQMALGPTHEEVITDMVRDLVRSYKQLPITLYQIQTKFRDEPRPRFGIVRTREFLMKDAYSIDADLAQLNQSYDAMYEAYCRIFDRCGLPYVIVEAESGPIGGDSSHEFMVPCSTGEDKVIQCVALRLRGQPGTCRDRRPRPTARAAPPRTPRRTRRCRRPTSGRSARSASSSRSTRRPRPSCWSTWPTASRWPRSCGATTSSTRPSSAGSLGATALVPADAATIEKATGAPMGFLGPVGIKIPLVIDRAIAAMPTVVVGGNAVDVHLKGVVPGRDFPLEHVHDLRNADAGDPCPRCGDTARDQAGPGDRPRLQARAPSIPSRWERPTSTRRGTRSTSIMGCYGIGINRIVAGAVEAGHDANGIIWPLALAPYQVVVVPLQVQNAAVMEQAAGAREGADGGRARRSGRRPRPAAGREVQGCRPDRDPAARRGRRARAQGRHDRDQVAQPSPEAKQIPAATAAEAILAEIAAARERHDAHCLERRQARAAARAIMSRMPPPPRLPYVLLGGDDARLVRRARS